MGDWQRGALAGKQITYLIGMQNGAPEITGDEPPSIAALNAWVDELKFEATHLLLDPDWEVIRRYWAANPDGTYSQAVTVILDRGMKIRRVGDTYDTNHQVNLQLLQTILAE